jgi:outer membrane protein assembly factor BamB
MYFDDQGMIYLNTTDAGPDTIKYSRQIDVTQRIGDVVTKVDPATGKTLWTAHPGSGINYISGKFIYSVESYATMDEEDESPYSAPTGFETLPHVRIKRIDPKTGKVLWEHYQARAPLDVEFDKNRIRLVFKKEVQVLKYLSF